MEKMGLKSINPKIPKVIKFKQQRDTSNVSIFERGFENKKNYLNSYFSDWSHGRRIEFPEKKIPPPISKKGLDYKRMKETFMVDSIRK